VVGENGERVVMGGNDETVVIVERNDERVVIVRKDAYRSDVNGWRNHTIIN
jgi:PHD/YefM family antitoxin component YafN of YafNO toxin-antitoxin module